MNSRSLILAALVLTALPAGHAAEPVAANSKIATATVYVDRAIITRTATVTLPAGTQEVRFAALPDSLDPDLIQVSGNGTAVATILDVRATSTQLALAANPRLAALLEQLRALQSEMRKITDRSTMLQQQRDYLDKIKAATVTPPAAEGGALPKLGEWQQLFAFYTEGMTKVLTDQQELDRARDDLQKRIAAVQREMNELQAPGQRTVKDVVVRLDVAEAGNLDLELQYTVNEASWAPTYDVRVTSATRSIALGYGAMVRQSTGEDWVGVNLVLSTARPAIGGTPPELSPWYVREQRPQAPRDRNAVAMEDTLRLAPFAAEARQEKALELEPPPPGSPLRSFTASVDIGLTSATFSIPYAADIPADNAPHKVVIATHPLEGKLSHLAVPKLAELAYMQAAVKNTSDFPLIAGPVNLYLDGTYVARSELETVMPQEEFDLDLGVDDAISVERKLVNRLQENTGLVSRRQRVTYDWLITIQNNRKTAEKIVVKDQLPIAQHEKIVVKLLAPDAGKVEKDDEGVVTWTLDLQPGEKRELPLQVSVEYPTDFPIAGLE